MSTQLLPHSVLPGVLALGPQVKQTPLPALPSLIHALRADEAGNLLEHHWSQITLVNLVAAKVVPVQSVTAKGAPWKLLQMAKLNRRTSLRQSMLGGGLDRVMMEQSSRIEESRLLNTNTPTDERGMWLLFGKS